MQDQSKYFMKDPCMNPVERSIKLRIEADFILQDVKLYEIIGSDRRVTPTGSYYLDLLMYPDIDLYISKVSIEEIFAIGEQFAKGERVIQVVFERSRIKQLPGGLYLKLRVGFGNWGRPWKIDIWSVDDIVVDEKMKEVDHFKAQLTPHLREQILKYKCSVLTKGHRTPMYSGHFIYKAFIDEGLTDYGDITKYLVTHGIRME